MIDFTSKLGEINGIEHNKGRKYPQNQVILDSIVLSIPPKHKCLSILIWVTSHKKSQKQTKKTFLYLGKTDMVLGNKAAISDWKLGRNSAPRWSENPPRKSHATSVSNGFDLDQHDVSPDLYPNCLQRLSADNKTP